MNADISPERRLFAANIRRREERIDLALAALLVAKEETPRLVIEDYLERLDQLAMELRIEIDMYGEPHDVCRGLGDFLARQQDFRGDVETYYEARNSYLNEVMDRRRGLPITLSIVYIEVARRAGLKLAPVSFPGHFLVKLTDSDIFIDPFTDGRLLDTEGCRHLLYEQYGDRVPFSESLLGATTKRQVISRMLTNLKGTYLRTEDYERALRTVELLTTVSPWDLDQIRDRGLIALRLGNSEQAIADLTAYTQHAAPGPERSTVEAALRRIEHP